MPSLTTALRKDGSWSCRATPQVPPEGSGPLSVSNGVFLKYVLEPGVLQDKKGPSIATEFGPLLPQIGGSGLGFSVTGIVSQRWDWGTVHLDVATNFTPDQHGELFLDAIIEGPSKWKIRPVFEIYSDSVSDGTRTFSALAGAIWQVNDKLSFDAAFRYALVDGRPVNEVRAGLTFGFPINLGRPMAAEFAKQSAAWSPLGPMRGGRPQSHFLARKGHDAFADGPGRLVTYNGSALSSSSAGTTVVTTRCTKGEDKPSSVSACREQA